MRKSGSQIAVCVLLAAGLTACGVWTLGPNAVQPIGYPPLAFRHRVSTTDLDVYWNCSRPEPGIIRMSGVVQNSGGRMVEFVDLELDGVDARGRSISEAKTSLADILLHTNETSPFSLDIRAPGPGGRLDLYYDYSLHPRPGSAGFGRSDVRNMARDVCDETQHLTR